MPRGECQSTDMAVTVPLLLQSDHAVEWHHEFMISQILADWICTHPPSPRPEAARRENDGPTARGLTGGLRPTVPRLRRLMA